MRDAKPGYYVYRLTCRRAQTGLACRRRARRLRQPHPQARADHAGQGRRPRPPDRGGQRADRAGDDGLLRRARDQRHAGRGRRDATPKSTSPPTTTSATSCGRSSDDATIARLTRGPTPLPALYIADGHHRSAAAARVAEAPAAGALARTVISGGAVSPSPDDHPRLQPRDPRPERAQARGAAGRDGQTLLRSRRPGQPAEPRPPARPAWSSTAAGTC